MKDSPEAYKSKAIKVLIIAVLCFVFYGNTIPNRYAYDDTNVITFNRFTKNGISGIPDLFKYDTFAGSGNDLKVVAGGRYRPLSVATFAIEYQFFGENPYLSHYFNVLFYALAAILLYIFLIKIFKPYVKTENFFDFPFIIALLFVAHPVHSEIIANIKGRDEILALAGSLGATIYILKYLDTNKYNYLLSGFLCFLLAMFSKENAITFLAIVPLSIYFYKKETLSKYFFSLLPLVLASIIFLSVRKIVLGEIPPPPAELMNNPLGYATVNEKYATIFYTLGLYIKLLFFPHPLTTDYYPFHIPLVKWNNIFALFSLIVYISMFVYALFNLGKKSVISYGILFYLATLSIVSNFFFPIGTIMSERFIFIPSIGFLIIIGWIYSTKLPLLIKSSNIRISLIMVILLLCFIKTYNRNKAWKDNFTLFATDVKTSFNSIKSNSAMSFLLLEKANQIDDSNLIKEYRAAALQHAKKVVFLYPDFFNGAVQLGSAYAENNILDSALLSFKRAIDLRPNKADQIFHGLIDPTMNKTDNINFKIKYYLEFYKQTPDNFYFNYNLGNLYSQNKAFLKESVFFLERAVSINPEDFNANKELGDVYRLSGNYEKASLYLEKAINIIPDDVPALQGLLSTYNLAGNREKANEIAGRIEELKKTVK